MLMKRKKIIFLFTGILGLLTFFIYLVDKKQSINPGLIEHFGLTQQTINNLKTKKELVSWLETEENNIWNSLEKELGISFKQLETLKKDSIDEYNDSIPMMIKNYGTQQKVTGSTQEFIKSIMVEFGIDPHLVTIVSWDFSSAAAATDTVIFVNENIFNQLAYEAKKYTIGHELIHLIKKDHSTNFFIDKMKKNISNASSKKEDLLHRLNRFQELRADTLSCLKDSVYAHGSIIFFKEHILKNGENENPSHPKNGLRLDLGKKIVALLESTDQHA